METSTELLGKIACENFKGLKNAVICQDERIQKLIPIQRTSLQEAICTAMTEEDAGPVRDNNH